MNKTPPSREDGEHHSRQGEQHVQRSGGERQHCGSMKAASVDGAQRRRRQERRWKRQEGLRQQSRQITPRTWALITARVGNY